MSGGGHGDVSGLIGIIVGPVMRPIRCCDLFEVSIFSL